MPRSSFVTTSRSSRRSARLSLAVAFSFAPFAASLVAADVTQLASDTVNNATSTAFNSATATSGTQAWSDAAAPAAGNHYFTQGFLLRTLNSGSSMTFVGDSLTIGGISDSASGALVLKNGTGAVVTISNLTVNGGAIISSPNTGSGGRTVAIAGSLVVGSAGGTLAASNNGTTAYFLDIQSTISGSGNLTVLGGSTTNFGDGSSQGGTGTVRLQADNSGYTGTITVNGTAASNNQGALGLQPSNAAKNATILINTTGSNPGLGFRNNATYEIGALGGSGIIALSNTGSDRVALTVGGNNVSTTFSGALLDRSAATNAGTIGTGSFTKIGSGTMTLTGANTFTYDVTISEGTLALGATNTLGGANKIILNGGILADGAGFANTLGTLDLDANSTIAVETGGTLVFADSSGQDWGTSTLSITGNFVSGSSIRVGTSNGALTANQLALINIPGFTAVGIDSGGFLTATSGGLSLLENWRVTHFGSASGTGDAANTADRDGDGLANLTEYALGSDPTVPSNLGYHTQTSGGVLQLVFNRVADPALTYTVQGSSDLGSWADVWTSSGSANLAGEVIVSDTISLSASQRRFMRLVITSTIP